MIILYNTVYLQGISHTKARSSCMSCHFQDISSFLRKPYNFEFRVSFPVYQRCCGNRASCLMYWWVYLYLSMTMVKILSFTLTWYKSNVGKTRWRHVCCLPGSRSVYRRADNSFPSLAAFSNERKFFPDRFFRWLYLGSFSCKCMCAWAIMLTITHWQIFLVICLSRTFSTRMAPRLSAFGVLCSIHVFYTGDFSYRVPVNLKGTASRNKILYLHYWRLC